jgi:REP element-mobilizing transposase RayT
VRRDSDTLHGSPAIETWDRGSNLSKKAQLRGAALLGQRYFVSTVGRDEAVIREYIKKQEQEDDG